MNEIEKKISNIITQKAPEIAIFSSELEKSEIIIYPACFETQCCFWGKHQFLLLLKRGFKINFPYSCRDIYKRVIIKNSPDDAGSVESPVEFPLITPSELKVIPKDDEIRKFKILDGGSSFVKSFLEFYNWDFKKINFSIIRNFASSFLPSMIKIIEIASKYKFNALFFQDEFGYNIPWFSEKFFTKELLPFYRRIADIIHKNGLYFFLHSCGEVNVIMKLLKNIVDVWHRGDWTDFNETTKCINDPSLPIIFADFHESPSPPPQSPQPLERGYIIGVK